MIKMEDTILIIGGIAVLLLLGSAFVLSPNITSGTGNNSGNTGGSGTGNNSGNTGGSGTGNNSPPSISFDPANPPKIPTGVYNGVVYSGATMATLQAGGLTTNSITGVLSNNSYLYIDYNITYNTWIGTNIGSTTASCDVYVALSSAGSMDANNLNNSTLNILNAGISSLSQYPSSPGVSGTMIAVRQLISITNSAIAFNNTF